MIVTAELLTYPHEVLRARQQDIRAYDGHTAGLISVVRRLYKTEGAKGFYTGFGVNMIKMLPHNAILFVVYEYLRSHLTF